MLRLKKISLLQFKNYAEHATRFEERIIGISGRNGAGKTNLLDAIYYLCFTRSYFHKNESLNILRGADGFRLEGTFVRSNETVEAVCVVRENAKKEFLLNDIAYTRLADHVGELPCVFIAPDDSQMITGGSEERRRYMDALFSQLDPSYLRHLIDYNKVLQQRNGYLKMIAETRQPDAGLMDAYDRQLSAHAQYVYNKRQAYLARLMPAITDLYNRISGVQEPVAIRYDSHLHDCTPGELLYQFRERDRFAQRTLAGIHRDDLALLLDDQPFKTLASQGQRKSLLFALKLAEFSLLKEFKQFSPLLLLDDVFEKLDEKRMHYLLQWVCAQHDAQIFITDTHTERILDNMQQIQAVYQSIQL